LILEDLGRYPGSSRPDVHGRIAPELDFGKVRRAFEQLLAEGKVLSEGSTKRRRYRLSTPERNAR
jgi:ATP-dependent DNA helicase RecG